MSEFDTSGFNFEKVISNHTDEVLLPMLKCESELLQREGRAISDIAGARTRIEAYHFYRCRILAFGMAIFPRIVTVDHRAEQLSVGAIYTDRLLMKGWVKRKVGSNIRKLRYGVGEQINLEGPIIDTTDPEYTLRSQLGDTYTNPESAYWQALPNYGEDADDKATFMLGVGLVCEQARLVEALHYTGQEHEDAMKYIHGALRDLQS